MQRNKGHKTTITYIVFDSRLHVMYKVQGLHNDNFSLVFLIFERSLLLVIHHVIPPSGLDLSLNDPPFSPESPPVR